MKKKRDVVILHHEGPGCPRCGTATTTLSHGPSFVPPVDRGYYRLWYRCDNPGCRTTMIMPPEQYIQPDKVEGVDGIEPSSAGSKAADLPLIETPRFDVRDHWWLLPMKLKRRWWKETDYGKNPPSDELVEAIINRRTT